MIKLRSFLKWASLVLLLLFFIPWVITFSIYFGAPFLTMMGFGLTAFHDSPLLNSPQTASFVYGCLIFLYYLFPFVCVFYFFKVLRVSVTEKTPWIIWMVLPFVVAIPLALIVNYSITGNKTIGKKEVSHVVLIAKAIVNTKAPWGTSHVVTGTAMRSGSFSVVTYSSPNVNQFPHKSYLRTCIGCYTTNNKLHCSCQNSDGAYIDTELDLLRVKNKQLQIQNCNGHLTADVENCP